MRVLKDLLSQPTTQPKVPTLPKGEVDEKTIFFLFNRIIEEQYGKRGRSIIHPSRYQERVLTLRVMSPLWANELVLQETVLRKRLNKALDEEIVQMIRIVHGLAAEER